MFIWEFVAGSVLEQIIDWLYAQIIGFLGEFFAMMGNMGADLFDMPWVMAVVTFFSYLAWSLYGTGLVVACFECGIESQSGRGSVKDTATNAIKGFMAVNLFTIAPVELYKLSVNLQGSLAEGITGLISSGDSSVSAASTSALSGIDPGLNPLFGVFVVILMGYAVIKVFFANLQRGGILLIQIAVGSLYMFSVPRGYIDGFVGWSKQVVGLCLTAFLQATVLVAGLMVFNSNMLLGLGLILASSEVPRIAGVFGMETGTKANIMSAVYATQQAVNITKTVVQAVAK